MHFHYKKGENQDLYAYMCGANDPDIVDYLGILMMTTLMLAEVDSDIILTP